MYYYNTFSGFTPNYLEHVGATNTATPTRTPTPTLPAPASGWVASDYTYSAEQPHAVAAVNKTQGLGSSYGYDANVSASGKSHINRDLKSHFFRD